MSQRVPWLPRDLPFLDERCPLPLTGPFTAVQAAALGVSRTRLATLTRRGLVRPVLRGVYAAAQVVDSIEFRAEALSLVVPPSAIVTDRTAAWLHQIDVLNPSAIHEMPPVEIYSRAGSRLRRPGVASGERRMRDEDVMVVNGVLVTTKLRTAFDLGRRLNRFHALAALDALLRAGCSAPISSPGWSDSVASAASCSCATSHPWPIRAQSRPRSRCCGCTGSKRARRGGHLPPR